MYTRYTAYVALSIAVVASIAGCGDGGTGSSMSCSTYNSVKTDAEQDFANTNAVAALLTAHGVNAGGNHHYNTAAGDYIMNVTVASDEVTSYCASNPGSTIDKGLVWSNFKPQ